jgi:hypothetical protein
MEMEDGGKGSKSVKNPVVFPERSRAAVNRPVDLGLMAVCRETSQSARESTGN